MCFLKRTCNELVFVRVKAKNSERTKKYSSLVPVKAKLVWLLLNVVTE